ncbi:coatomer subunit delta-like [Schistocerca gregaria]|uniref:coatomer subunit delta-like n=1 Tax=Schistocerca gregaria TaxID=7010 RepID=UPI00211E11F3|nr:coatomer subunit delta-like [Schistocerca gregaria]
MVVIAAAICTKLGKAIVSRQFVEITRSGIENLLSAFPKLIADNSKYYTYVDGPGVRYVYQILEENFYVVLITNKASNIIEDTKTLQLINSIIYQQCGTICEDQIVLNAFELIFALDEMISLGHQERITCSQVMQFLEMDSLEEKMAEMVRRSQEQEAAREGRRRVKEIERKKKAQMQHSVYSISSNSENFYGGSSLGEKIDEDRSHGIDTTPKELFNNPKQSGKVLSPGKALPTTKKNPNASSVRKGLKLSNAKLNEYQDIVHQELLTMDGQKDITNADEQEQLVTKGSMSDKTSEDEDQNFYITMNENLFAKLDREGKLKDMEVRGNFDILIHNSQYTQISVVFEPKKISNIPFEYKLHPNCDKQRFLEQNTIVLKDTNREFLVDASNMVLRWHATSQDTKHLPLLINCWSTSNPDVKTLFNLEYELCDVSLKIHDLIVSIRISTESVPRITSVDGKYLYNQGQRILAWKVPVIDSSNATGTIEFELDRCSSRDVESMFPVQATFYACSTMFGMKPANVVYRGDVLEYKFEPKLVAEYLIE